MRTVQQSGFCRHGCTPHRGSSFTCARHLMVIHAHSERVSSTLSPPLRSTSSSSHSSFIPCTSSSTSSTSLRAVASLCTPPKSLWTLLTSPNPTTSRRFTSSPTQSLTHPQFSEQAFLEDVECDDTALEDMLREAYREHVHHSR